MGGSHLDWWMDAKSRWHQGRPPPDWWQANDGRWHPPAPGDTTAEVTIGPSEGGTHLAGDGRRKTIVQTYRGWPKRARVAALVSATLLALGAVGVAATEGLREGDRNVAVADESTTTTGPEITVPSSDASTAAATATTTVDSTTTTAVRTTTAPPLPDETSTTVAPDPGSPVPTTPPHPDSGVHPRAFCSPEGATGLSEDGVPMTCTTQKCRGTPYDQPRWRPTTC